MEIIHISDTHFGPDRKHSVRGSRVLDRVEQLVAEISKLPFVPDLILHTGDVVNDPDENAYRLAEETLSQLPCPVYYATGNHDDRQMMRRFLTFGDFTSLLEDGSEICYRVESQAARDENIDIIVMDGMVPPEDGPHGEFSTEQMESVLSEIDPAKSTAIFLHFPLLPIGSAWIDEHLLVRNGPAFLQRLRDLAGDRILGIFTGHIHRGLQMQYDGILHSGVSSPACEFTAGPGDDFCDFLPDCSIPFHHITMTEKGVSVKAYSLPVGHV